LCSFQRILISVLMRLM